MKDIIKMADEKDEFVTSDDGFVYWWPKGLDGYVSAQNLRDLATELDARNEKWEKTINEYFDGFKCPINFDGCKENCGNYGCNN